MERIIKLNIASSMFGIRYTKLFDKIRTRTPVYVFFFWNWFYVVYSVLVFYRERVEQEIIY